MKNRLIIRRTYKTTYCLHVSVENHSFQPVENHSFQPCQFCAGTSFVSKILEGLQPSQQEFPTVVLDMLGFDGFSAIHCLTQHAKGCSE